MQTSFLLEPWSYCGRNVAAGTCNRKVELRSTALKRHDGVGNGRASQLIAEGVMGAALFFGPSFSLSRSRFFGLGGGGRARTSMAAPVDLLAWCPRSHPKWPRALHKAHCLVAVSNLSRVPTVIGKGKW